MVILDFDRYLYFACIYFFSFLFPALLTIISPTQAGLTPLLQPESLVCGASGPPIRKETNVNRREFSKRMLMLGIGAKAGLAKAGSAETQNRPGDLYEEPPKK